MENIEQEPTPDFVRGFNQGYALHKHFPDVAAQMTKVLEHAPGDHAQGIIAGHQEFGKEKEQVFYISWNKLPDHYDELIPERERDKDIDEPEPGT
jgi:hypothetical protein